jgi:outer membrane protein TolC
VEVILNSSSKPVAPVGRHAVPARAGVLFAFLLGTSALQPVRGAEVLTLQRALQLAQARSQQLVASQAAASAAREMAGAAGERPDPVLKAGLSNVPVNGPDRFSLTSDFMTMRSIALMQELTHKDKRLARSRRYEREAELAQASGSLALADLRRDTALAWLDRHYQQRIREELTAERDQVRLSVEAADAAYRGGRGSQAEVYAARSAVVQIDDRIAQVDLKIATAITRLQRWIGEPAADSLGPVDPMDRAPISAGDLRGSLEQHPQLAVVSGQLQLAESEAEVARTERRPDWSAELMYSQRGPAYSNMVSINFTVPVPWNRARRQDRELAARLAQVDQARAEREEALRAHRAEVEAMLQQWQSDRERLRRYDQELLPLADQRAQAAMAAYRGGSASLSTVLDARRSGIEIRLDRVNLEWEAAQIWAQLSYMSGEHGGAGAND